MYPEAIVKPMKAELVSAGFEELLSPEDVDKAITSEGTVLMVVNSVCGCAAGAARPGVKKSLENGKKPVKLTTVFAGFDTDAVAQARNILPLTRQAVRLLPCLKTANWFILLNVTISKDTMPMLFLNI
jgi:putative YphP/YqiW family bacilliredoxin